MKKILINNKKKIIWIVISILFLGMVILAHHYYVIGKRNAFYYEYQKNPKNYDNLNKSIFTSINSIPKNKRQVFDKSGIEIYEDQWNNVYQIEMDTKEIDILVRRSGELTGSYNLGKYKERDDHIYDSYTYDSAKTNKAQRRIKWETEKLFFQKMKLLYDNWILFK